MLGCSHEADVPVVVLLSNVGMQMGRASSKMDYLCGHLDPLADQIGNSCTERAPRAGAGGAGEGRCEEL